MERRGLLEGWLGTKRSRNATIGGPEIAAIVDDGDWNTWSGVGANDLGAMASRPSWRT